MTNKITFAGEFIIGCLTFISTLIMGDFLIDLVVGVVTYTGARLFYRYYSGTIISIIEKLKNKFK